MKIVSIGEVLWDVIGGQEHLGGAPFNFAAHARKLGHEVCFISAVGCDERGRRVLERMAQMDLSTRFIRRVEGFPTGIASVTLDSNGQPSFRIEHPAAYDFPDLTAADLEDLLSPAPDWIYFGTLAQESAGVRAATGKLLTAKTGARCLYDVNLRPSCYTPQLVRDLMSQATVVKLNDEEVSLVEQMFGSQHSSLEGFCHDLADRLGLEAVCVTQGAEGCIVLTGDKTFRAPGYAVKVVDAVGAGDAFAAAFVHGLGSGWPGPQVADFANCVGALVASRPGAIPPWTMDDIEKLGK
ncbi:MAG TPA: PfkB family carbohydrate kinase [Terriglobia bacterium]|nr:PfkB family carbohydrate kinase [Terriglobia bacterium]